MRPRLLPFIFVIIFLLMPGYSQARYYLQCETEFQGSLDQQTFIPGVLSSTDDKAIFSNPEIGPGDHITLLSDAPFTEKKAIWKRLPDDAASFTRNYECTHRKKTLECHERSDLNPPEYFSRYSIIYISDFTGYRKRNSDPYVFTYVNPGLSLTIKSGSCRYSSD